MNKFFDPLSKMENVLKRNTVSENVIPQAQGSIKRKPPPLKIVWLPHSLVNV